MTVEQNGELTLTSVDKLRMLADLFSLALTDPEKYLDPNDFDIDSFKCDNENEL